MSSDPKKLSVDSRETASAKRLRSKGERVTIDYKDTFGGIEAGLGLGFILDGKVYRSPGISERAARIDQEKSFVVIRDGGKAYDRNYNF